MTFYLGQYCLMAIIETSALGRSFSLNAEKIFDYRPMIPDVYYDSYNTIFCGTAGNCEWT